MPTIYLDASALSGWSNCREYYRRRDIEKIETIKPNTHYEFGKAVHLAVEEFWKGNSYEKALDAAYGVCNEFPVAMLNPPELETWERLVKCTPDILACYYDSVTYSPEQLLWVEKEWSIPYADHARSKSTGSTEGYKTASGSDVDRLPDTVIPSDISGNQTQVILCGRMDRLMVGPRLVDVKTASEIAQGGIPWKQQYRQDKILDLQFALYDWYLQQVCAECGHVKDEPGYCSLHMFKSMAPIEIYLEVLLKPYKSKAARYEKIELNELITDSYRKRFAQQLKWKVSEIVHYVENYSQQKPWPLAGGLACSSKYGKCAYIDLCAWGDSDKTMKKFKERVPHLELVRLGK